MFIFWAEHQNTQVLKNTRLPTCSIINYVLQRGILMSIQQDMGIQVFLPCCFSFFDVLFLFIAIGCFCCIAAELSILFHVHIHVNIVMLRNVFLTNKKAHGWKSSKYSLESIPKITCICSSNGLLFSSVLVCRWSHRVSHVLDKHKSGIV